MSHLPRTQLSIRSIIATAITVTYASVVMLLTGVMVKLTESMVAQRERRRAMRLLQKVRDGRLTVNQARERLGLRAIPLLDGAVTPVQVDDSDDP